MISNVLKITLQIIDENTNNLCKLINVHPDSADQNGILTGPALGHCNVCARSGPRTSKGPTLITIIVIMLIPTQIGPHAIVSHRAPQ